jgi:hypothetical protein
VSKDNVPGIFCCQYNNIPRCFLSATLSSELLDTMNFPVLTQALFACKRYGRMLPVYNIYFALDFETKILRR